MESAMQEWQFSWSGSSTLFGSVMMRSTHDQSICRSKSMCSKCCVYINSAWLLASATPSLYEPGKSTAAPEARGVQGLRRQAACLKVAAAVIEAVKALFIGPNMSMSCFPAACASRPEMMPSPSWNRTLCRLCVDSRSEQAFSNMPPR